jgi:hypothetical protein
MEVTERRAAPALLSGYERRLAERRHATTSVTFITTEDIERRHTDLVTALLSQIPGLRVTKINTAQWRVFGLSRGKGFAGGMCIPAIYLDGTRLPDNDINDAVTTSNLVGIEVYTSANAAPVEFQQFNGGCAVIVAWTKH